MSIENAARVWTSIMTPLYVKLRENHSKYRGKFHQVPTTKTITTKISLSFPQDRKKLFLLERN